MATCGCGCGAETRAARTYVLHHRARLQQGGELSHKWRGGRQLQRGYVMVYQPDHPRAIRDKVREHILVVEKALGRYLVPPELVHHVDGDKSNNTPGNLVLCPDLAYHALLHRRDRALKACGNPNWRKCYLCKSYSDPAGMCASGRTNFIHPDCRAVAARRCYLKRRSQKAAA